MIILSRGRSSFMIYYFVALGWQTDIVDKKEAKLAQKHIKRIQRRGMFGEIPNHRYRVCVSTKFFGLIHEYTLGSC